MLGEIPFGKNLPIGSPTAPVGWPAPELVETIFGLRSVRRAEGMGLFRLFSDHNEGDRYALDYVENNGTHLTAFILSYGIFHLGVHFEARSVTSSMFAAMPQYRHVEVDRSTNPWRTQRTNVEIRLRW